VKKDAYYFPHDSNAKDDPKCVMLIEQLGLEGYGIYWVLVEMLRDQPEYRYPMSLVPSIARRYNTQAPKVETVIRGYDLFKIENEDFFFSESLIERMLPLERKRELASIAGKKSAEKRALNAPLQFNGCSTDVQPAFNGCSTDVQPIEESRVEESKKEKNNKSFVIPSVEEISVYCKDRNNNIKAQYFYDYNSARGWMVGKNKMKDWKAAIRTWENNDKTKSTENHTREVADF